MDGKGFQVLVDLDGRPGADRSLPGRPSPKSSAGSSPPDLDPAEIHLNGRPYRLTRPDVNPPPVS